MADISVPGEAYLPGASWYVEQAAGGNWTATFDLTGAQNSWAAVTCVPDSDPKTSILGHWALHATVSATGGLMFMIALAVPWATGVGGYTGNIWNFSAPDPHMTGYTYDATAGGVAVHWSATPKSK